MKDRSKWRVVLVALITGAMLLTMATAALAERMRGGWGDDETWLYYYNNVGTSNRNGVWQSSIVADLGGCMSIDGVFGSQTRSRTKTWQSTFGLSNDGVVGPATYGKWQDRTLARYVGTQGNANLYKYGVGSDPDRRFYFFWVDPSGATNWEWKELWSTWQPPGTTVTLHTDFVWDGYPPKQFTSTNWCP